MAILVDDLVELMADFVAMRLADRGADITGGEYLLVPDNDTAAPAAVAGGAAGHLQANGHEIFIPGWAQVSGFCHSYCLPYGIGILYSYRVNFIRKEKRKQKAARRVVWR